MMKNRKILNLFIEPKEQTKTVLHVFFWGTLVCGSNFYAGTLIMDQIDIVLKQIPDPSAQLQINHYVSLAVSYSLALNMFFVIIAALIVLIWGHRFFGAQFKMVTVIKEQFLKGDFSQPVQIRKNDYLHDLKDALEELRLKLKGK